MANCPPKSIFDEIEIGEEITATYSVESSGLKSIYAIKYGRKMYLTQEQVLRELEQSQKEHRIIGLAVMALSAAQEGIYIISINPVGQGPAPTVREIM